MRRGLSGGAALWAGLSGAEAAWASGGEGEAGLRGMGRFAGEGKGPVGEGEWAGLRFGPSFSFWAEVGLGQG